MLIECLTTRWRDHVGPGEDRHIKFRSDDELDNAIKNDDLLRLESMLSEKEVKKINDEVDNKINEAIKYSEKSSFPDASEITEEVYG